MPRTAELGERGHRLPGEGNRQGCLALPRCTRYCRDPALPLLAGVPRKPGVLVRADLSGPGRQLDAGSRRRRQVKRSWWSVGLSGGQAAASGHGTSWRKQGRRGLNASPSRERRLGWSISLGAVRNTPLPPKQACGGPGLWQRYMPVPNCVGAPLQPWGLDHPLQASGAHVEDGGGHWATPRARMPMVGCLHTHSSSQKLACPDLGDWSLHPATPSPCQASGGVPGRQEAGVGVTPVSPLSSSAWAASGLTRPAARPYLAGSMNLPVLTHLEQRGLGPTPPPRTWGAAAPRALRAEHCTRAGG